MTAEEAWEGLVVEGVVSPDFEEYGFDEDLPPGDDWDSDSLYDYLFDFWS